MQIGDVTYERLAVKVGFGASVSDSECAKAPVAARARTESATLRICGTKDREEKEKVVKSSFSSKGCSK
jgi:hypothetical protein